MNYVISLRVIIKLKTMKREVENHQKHLEATLEKLFTVLFPGDEFDRILSDKEHAAEIIGSRKAWIKTSDLVYEDVTTEKMVLIHLLWFQRIGRIVIDDIDPFSGAVLIRMDFSDSIRKKEKERRDSRIS